MAEAEAEKTINTETVAPEEEKKGAEGEEEEKKAPARVSVAIFELVLTLNYK